MARTARTTTLRAPPFFFSGALAGGGAAAGSDFSTLKGLLISVPSLSRPAVGPGIGIDLWIGIGRIVRDRGRCLAAGNQVADRAGGARQVEARLGFVGLRVDPAVAGRGERRLGVVDLDRGGDAGLEAVARQVELVLRELQALVRQLDPAAGVLVGEQGLAHLLLDLALSVVLLDQELVALRLRGGDV